MDAAKDVIATFMLAQVKNKTSGKNYATLTEALSMAADGNELLLLGMQYNGAISLNSGITLNGGWDGVFGNKSGLQTALNDGLTILGGMATVETITVKGMLSLRGGVLRAKDVKVLP
jgi:hypothetical protein